MAATKFLYIASGSEAQPPPGKAGGILGEASLAAVRLGKAQRDKRLFLSESPVIDVVERGGSVMVPSSSISTWLNCTVR